MEIRVLKYFLMVSREENITKAANLLHITQPTLSRQLRQLEEEFDVKLFDRGTHNVTLTEEGMLLKRRAQEIVSLAEKTKQEFNKEKDNLTGEIAIGCGEIHGMNILSEIMASFHEKYPLVTYEIYSGNADIIKEKIENGTLDIGLLIEPVDISKYEFVRIPIKEEFGLFVRKDSPLTSKEYITPEDLLNLPIISPKRYLVQNEISSWFGDYAEEINIISTYNLMYNATIMVEKNLGVLIGIKLDVKYKDLSFIPLKPKIELGSVLAWKKSQRFSPVIKEFIEHTKNA
mgnify:FL=1|nr:LysR family transcriptional regulator [uncultured Terrisporobacter sp.]